MSAPDEDIPPANKFHASGYALKIWLGVASTGVGLLISIFTLRHTVWKSSDIPSPPFVQAAHSANVRTTQQPQEATPPVEDNRREIALTHRATPTSEQILVQNEVQPPAFESTVEVDYLDSEGHGEGSTREEALGSALMEAVGKRVGMDVSAKISMALNSSVHELNNRRLARTDEQITQNFEKATSGLLKWWDIRTEKIVGGTYVIEVVVVVAQVHQGQTDHPTRLTIAVLPFRSEAYGQGSNGIPALAQLLRDSILSDLTSSRKFAVVDKSFKEEIDSLNAEAPAADTLQLLLEKVRQLGSQFVVTGSLSGVSIGERKIGDLQVKKLEGIINLRVIDTKTRQTVLATSYNLATTPKLPVDVNGLGATLGQLMTERILETIYPIRVASTDSPDGIVLDRGGESMLLGTRYEIFNTGREMKDQSTGESLGLSEHPVAVAEITSVLSKVSYAKLISSTEVIQIGAVCRRPQSVKIEKPKDDIDSLFK